VRRADGERGVSVYRPLASYLSAQGGARIELTFEQIEALIGRPLPPSAGGRGWWRNYGRTRAHARSWLDAGWRVEEPHPRERRVAFVPAATPRPDPRPVYGRLGSYLRARAEGEIALTLTELEALLERPLPRSARTDRSWWRNRRIGAPQARAWLDAGWRVSAFDRRAAVVRFVHDGGATDEVAGS
jgi:hypothetical protein